MEALSPPILPPWVGIDKERFMNSPLSQLSFEDVYDELSGSGSEDVALELSDSGSEDEPSPSRSDLVFDLLAEPGGPALAIMTRDSHFAFALIAHYDGYALFAVSATTHPHIDFHVVLPPGAVIDNQPVRELARGADPFVVGDETVARQVILTARTVIAITASSAARTVARVLAYAPAGHVAFKELATPLAPAVGVVIENDIKDPGRYDRKRLRIRTEYVAFEVTVSTLGLLWLVYELFTAIHYTVSMDAMVTISDADILDRHYPGGGSVMFGKACVADSTPLFDYVTGLATLVIHRQKVDFGLPPPPPIWRQSHPHWNSHQK